MTSILLRPALLLAAAALAAAARASAPAPAFSFDGAPWQFRDGGIGGFEFEPAPPIDPDRRADRIVIVVMDVPTTGFGAPRLAVVMLRGMREDGTVLKAWTLPGTTSNATDYLILGRSRNMVSHEIEVNFPRITTTAEGFPEVLSWGRSLAADTPDEAVAQWLAGDGARIEHALATWRDIPSLAALRAMRREKTAGP